MRTLRLAGKTALLGLGIACLSSTKPAAPVLDAGVPIQDAQPATAAGAMEDGAAAAFDVQREGHDRGPGHGQRHDPGSASPSRSPTRSRWPADDGRDPQRRYRGHSALDVQRRHLVRRHERGGGRRQREGLHAQAHRAGGRHGARADQQPLRRERGRPRRRVHDHGHHVRGRRRTRSARRRRRSRRSRGTAGRRRRRSSAKTRASRPT